MTNPAQQPYTPGTPMAGPTTPGYQQGTTPLGTPTDPAADSGRRSNKKDKGKAPNRKVINRSRNLAVLAALGFGAAYLFAVQNSEDNAWVVRAKTDIAPLSQISAANIEAVELPTTAVEPGAITAESGEDAIAEALEAFDGLQAQNPIASGSQLRTEAFAMVIDQDNPLGADERLISVRAEVSSAVAGALRAGDRIDIIAVSGDVAGVVATNIEVVRVQVDEDTLASVARSQTGEDKNKKADELLPAAPLGGTYLVRVPADLATRLAVVDASADRVFLTYRAPDSASGTQNVVDLLSTICGVAQERPAACEGASQGTPFQDQ